MDFLLSSSSHSSQAVLTVVSDILISQKNEHKNGCVCSTDKLGDRQIEPVLGIDGGARGDFNMASVVGDSVSEELFQELAKW